MNNDIKKDELDEIIALLDGFVEKEVSRFKISVSDELAPGEIKETYHHGRCDVGSPWAEGKAFDDSSCDRQRE